jgi:hypothetical protein
MRHAYRHIATIELDLRGDHAALFERVNEDRRGDPVERQSGDERNSVVAVKPSLACEVSVRKTSRVRYFVEQVPAAVSERADVDFLKAHHVAAELDDHVCDRRKRPARTSIDEEDVPVERKVIEYVPRRSRAEKQVPG